MLRACSQRFINVVSSVQLVCWRRFLWSSLTEPVRWWILKLKKKSVALMRERVLKISNLGFWCGMNLQRRFIQRKFVYCCWSIWLSWYVKVILVVWKRRWQGLQKFMLASGWPTNQIQKEGETWWKRQGKSEWRKEQKGEAVAGKQENTARSAICKDVSGTCGIVFVRVVSELLNVQQSALALVH